MKISKAYLGSIISEYINRNYICNKNNFINKFREVMNKIGVSIDIVGDLLNDSKVAVESMDMLSMYQLTKGIVIMNDIDGRYDVIKGQFRNIRDIFTDIEIQELEEKISLLKSNPVDEEKIKRELLTFEDVRKVSYDQYSAIVPVQKLIDLYNHNLIRYNTSAQRDTKKGLYRNAIIEKINIDFNQVDEIAKLVCDGLFIPNTITLNVLPSETGEQSILFDESSNVLYVNGIINILDGFHRSLGYQEALRMIPDLKLNIEIRITNFDIQKARRFIVQEDKQRKMDLEHIKRLEHNYINQLLNKVQAETDFGKVISRFENKSKQFYLLEPIARSTFTDLFDEDITTYVELQSLFNDLQIFLNIYYDYLVNDIGKTGSLHKFEFFESMVIFKVLRELKVQFTDIMQVKRVLNKFMQVKEYKDYDVLFSNKARLQRSFEIYKERIERFIIKKKEGVLNG